MILALIAAGIAGADDTSIYGSTAVSVAPNVLVVFDTSGSMSTQDVPGEYYNPATTYAGTKTTNAVYQKTCGWSCSYNVFATNVSLIACPDAKTALETNGRVSDDVRDSASGFTCGGTVKDLYMGNWLNYDTSVSSTRKRIDVAKDVINKLIDDTDNVNFGLMRFNYDQGGELVKAIGPVTTVDEKNAFKTKVNALTADGYTPLAETMAEAGLYFAGKTGWFESVTYTSPILYRCQKNYIILMTDGDPTRDDDSKLVSGNYINGNKIADYNGDGSSGKLDDVSAYLFQEDLMPPPMGTAGESFERQNIVTYTIGFKSQQDLLGRTALNGGGKYYTAESTSGLEAAFQEIVSEIAEVNAVFVSPVVPVSRMNRTFAGNSLYVGFFKPQGSGRWAGNIKKFGLDATGALIDVNSVPATLSDGSIKDNAQSYWPQAEADGPDVQKGGVGAVLLDQASRNLYSYLVTGTTALTNSVNAFSLANTTNLTAAKLGVLTSTDRDSIINDTIGASRSWILGDVLHSQPAVVHYDTTVPPDGILDDAYIYAGANDGMMHAFKDSTGAEAWGFIPPSQLDRLKLFIDTTPSHDYYIDGAPVVYEGTSQKILFFGERRGGYTYHALDVTAPTAPVWLYKIEANHLVNVDGDNNGSVDGVNATLGQSWGTPPRGKIKISSTPGDSETVFFLPGGYDPNQDNQVPAANDTMGRAVFSVNVATGVPSKLNVNAGNNAAMTHSITDVAVFDSNANGYVNRAYAGDLGGNVFAFEDDNGDGTWTFRRLFTASHDDGDALNFADDGVQKKIMYAPDATLELYGDLIFFGTGDRADPEETGVVNRLYAIKNEWTDPATFSTLTEADLVDVTDNLLILGNETQRAEAQLALQTKKGWYIRLGGPLENPGEKITASVTVFAGVVYFTTYTPEVSGPPPTDPCAAAAGRGQARLYAVNYLTGGAVYDWSSTPEFTGDTTPVEVPLGKRDRSKLIGTSIPSAPVIAVLPGGAKMYIGVEGGVTKQDPTAVTDVNAFYWRQIN